MATTIWISPRVMAFSFLNLQVVQSFDHNNLHSVERKSYQHHCHEEDCIGQKY